MGGLIHFTVLLTRASLLRVGHRVATLLDSTRESILALRYNFWRLQGTQSCRGKPVLICILALSLVFTPYLSNAVVSANRHIIFHALVALKLLVSLISRLVACSARIVVDRQTNRQTHRPTTVTLAAHARRGLINRTALIVLNCDIKTPHLSLSQSECVHTVHDESHV